MGLGTVAARIIGAGRGRHKDVLEQVATPANLTMAWGRVRRRMREAAREDPELVAFEADAPAALARLRADLRRGRYRPGAARRVRIRKPNGSVRRLTLLPLEDRIAQTATVQVLTPLMDAEFAEASFGFRPNRSLADALERVLELRRAGRRWVLSADIEDCFERVDHGQVLARLRGSIADRPLLRLIERWLGAFADGGRGLPQGAPLSPLLCNVALDPIDHALQRRTGGMVRYADDLVILCRSRRKANEAWRRARDLLEPHGLRLHPGKTGVASFSSGFFFLGHYFVHDLVLRDAAAESCEEVRRRAQRAARAKGTFWRRWLAPRS